MELWHVRAPDAGVKDYARVEVTSRAALRRWLNAHHLQAEPIWLVTAKKAAGKRHIPYDAIVEEALCFGWVDSLPRALDAERSMRLLSPRKARSGWSAANRARVARLIAQGAMAPAGQAKVDAAIADGSWLKLASAEKGQAPPDLEAALTEADSGAGWAAFSLATRKRLIEFLDSARKPQTRVRRVEQIVAGAKRGTDPLDWHRRGGGD